MKPADSDPRTTIRRLNLAGILIILALFGGVGTWVATAKIAGAVIAVGRVVVESDVKKVQHPTGGVVKEILVHEGDEVKEGQVLVRLDDTLTRATLGVIRSQLDELMSRQARLMAERDDATHITFPDELLERNNEKSLSVAMAGEQKLFESRRNARIGQREQLTKRIAQTNEEIRGLTAQQAAKEKEIMLTGKELVGVTSLYKQNLVAITRYMQLQRDMARMEGERGQFIADIARAKGKISETELQIIQIDKDFGTDVLKDLRDTQGKIAELKERLVAAQDQLNRVDIRAPRAGIVNQLAIHTVGGVISNGETLMQIVPHKDKLIVEAKVAPHDIDQVVVGSSASVRIEAGETRATPELVGKLIYVSADLTREQPAPGVPAQSFYSVRVSLSDHEVKRLGAMRLIPGMPAEVFIQTYPRTALQYLIKPLEDQIARTFRER